MVVLLIFNFLWSTVIRPLVALTVTPFLIHLVVPGLELGQRQRKDNSVPMANFLPCAGRVVIVASLHIPKLKYKASVTCCPSNGGWS